MFNFMFPAQVL